MADMMAAADACMICYDKPDLYGLLQNCQHPYCYECIKHWRNPNKKTAAFPQGGVSSPPSPADLLRGWMPAQAGSSNGAAPQSSTQAPNQEAGLESAARPYVNVLTETFDSQTMYNIMQEAWRLYGSGSLDDDAHMADEPLNDSYGISQEHSNGNKRDTKLCPFCSEPSDFVIPAIQFPQTAQDKQHILKGFYMEKKKILCRDFEAHVNVLEGFYCPRFNDCIYAHLKPVDDPNSQVRNEPFVFTQERIAQLKARRSLTRGRTSGVLPVEESVAALGLPDYVLEGIRSSIASTSNGMIADAYNNIARGLVEDFLRSYQEHVDDIAEVFRDIHRRPLFFPHADTDFATHPGGSLVRITKRFVRFYDEEGHYVRQTSVLDSPPLGNTEICRDPVIQYTRTLLDGVRWNYYEFRAPPGVSLSGDAAHGEWLAAIVAQNKAGQETELRSWEQYNRKGRRLYYIFTEEGEFLDYRDQDQEPISDEFPTLTEFFDPIIHDMDGVANVEHRFLSPLSGAEAKAIIVSGPSFQGLKCAILSLSAGAETFSEDSVTELQNLLSDMESLSEAESAHFAPFHSANADFMQSIYETHFEMEHEDGWSSLDEDLLDEDMDEDEDEEDEDEEDEDDEEIDEDEDEDEEDAEQRT